MMKGPDGLKMSAERQWGGPEGRNPPGRSLNRGGPGAPPAWEMKFPQNQSYDLGSMFFGI